MGALNYLIYEPKDENGWHFDTTENVISLILQLPQSGGKYQYIHNLRSPEDQNLGQVSDRMKNPDSPSGIDTASLSPGTLLFFKGKNTLHRVTRVSGDRERIVAILSYHNKAGHQLSDGSRMAMYGRVAKID